MAWTAPVTWTAGQIVGASDLNAQIRDNMLWLQGNRPAASITASPAFATTSTTFVAVNTTTCRVTLITSHANAKVLIVGGLSMSTIGTSVIVFADVLIDGSTQASGNGTNGYGESDGNAAHRSIAMSSVNTIVAAGSHTFDAAVRLSAATSSTVSTCTLSVVEVA